MIEKAVQREWRLAQPSVIATTGKNGSTAKPHSQSTAFMREKLTALRSTMTRTASNVHRSAVNFYEGWKRKGKHKGKGKEKRTKLYREHSDSSSEEEDRHDVHQASSDEEGIVPAPAFAQQHTLRTEATGDGTSSHAVASSSPAALTLWDASSRIPESGDDESGCGTNDAGNSEANSTLTSPVRQGRYEGAF